MTPFRADERLQRLLAAGSPEPLATRDRHVAWQGTDWQVECSRVHNATTNEESVAMRVTPTMAGRYGAEVDAPRDDGRLFLVARYRHPIAGWSVELPRFDLQCDDDGWRDPAELELRRLAGLIGGELRLLGAVHADPALLSGSTLVLLAEHCRRTSVPERERGAVMEHLSRCGDCRQVVALALPEMDAAAPVLVPARKGWLTWPVVRWGLGTDSATALTLPAPFTAASTSSDMKMALNEST